MDTKYFPLEETPCSAFPIQSHPLILGSVCHSWRQIVYATPRLWSMILIHIPQSTAQYIIHYLQYSRSAPLIVRLYDFGSSFSETDNLSDQVLGIIALVKQHLHRIAVLCLDLQCRLTDAFSQDLKRPDAVPALEELHLHCSTLWCSHVCAMPHNLTISIDAPRPHKVTLSSSSILKNIQVDWSNVRHLSLSVGPGKHAHSPILDTLSLLSEAKQLRVVDLQFDYLVSSGTLTGTMVIQNSIRYLRLFGHSAQTILSHTTMPNLQFLGLWATQLDNTNDLLSFLRRSMCPLISLSWTPYSHLPSRQEVIEIFRCTPKLQQLFFNVGAALDQRDVVDYFLEQLGMTVSHGEVEPTILHDDALFLPLLQKFIYAGPLKNPPLSHFLDAIESRNLYNVPTMVRNQVAQPLLELVIHDAMKQNGEKKFELPTGEDLQRILQLNATGQKISVHDCYVGVIDSDMRTYYRDDAS